VAETYVFVQLFLGTSSEGLYLLGFDSVIKYKYYLDLHAEHGSDGFETDLYDGETKKVLAWAWPGTVSGTSGRILDASGWPGFVEDNGDHPKGDISTTASRFIDTVMSEKNDIVAPEKKEH
jgi:hypothetical protein